MIHYQTRGGIHAATRIRRVLEAMAGDLAAPVLDDVQLLTTELVSNCVMHGDAGLHNEIQLGYSTPDGMVRVEVTDPGGGFELEMPAFDPTMPGGFGLLIVDRVASQWGLSHDGRCVWFEVSRESALRR
jgi:serine/threonine-protein kinase RsbW